MGWDGKAVTDTLLAAKRQDATVALRECDHAWDVRPAETHAGHVASAVNWIADAERLAVVIVRPLRGIVVQADCSAFASSQVYVMTQRIEFEPQFVRQVRHDGGEVVGAGDFFDDAHVMQRLTVQQHKASQPQGASQAALVLPAALSRRFVRSCGFSFRRSALLSVLAMYHKRLDWNIYLRAGRPTRVVGCRSRCARSFGVSCI
jgi:hypothetical protein